jgi:hypothetical protein
MTGACAFPDCGAGSTTTNRVGQSTCDLHRPVVVVGSYVNDPKKSEGGHG